MKTRPTKQKGFQVYEDQIPKLKLEAIEKGSNMSAIIRELIDEHFKENQNK